MLQLGVAPAAFFGLFPEFRKLPGAKAALPMPTVIEIVMMSVVAVIGIFGLAWGAAATRRTSRHRSLE